MRVAVGSENPVKLAATEAAFGSVAGTTVQAVAVDSGVADQPVGHAETVRGAETRARRALAAGAYDLGVGIEGGVAEFPARAAAGPGDVAEPDGADGLYVVMWAAVTDGDRLERGAGPSLRLPAAVAARVRDGEELGPVMDEEFGLENVAESAGAVGVLTGGVVGRREALTAAVAGALGPFVTDCYG